MHKHTSVVSEREQGHNVSKEKTSYKIFTGIGPKRDYLLAYTLYSAFLPTCNYL